MTLSEILKDKPGIIIKQKFERGPDPKRRLGPTERVCTYTIEQNGKEILRLTKETNSIETLYNSLYINGVFVMGKDSFARNDELFAELLDLYTKQQGRQPVLQSEKNRVYQMIQNALSGNVRG